MLEILHDYGRAYLWSDGHQWSGVAITLWLLVCSSVTGLLLSIPLALACLSRWPLLRGTVWLYTYLIRGTPLYVQLLLLYVGVYSLDAVQHTPSLNHFFREGFNCTLLAFGLNTCAYTAEILGGAIRSMPQGELEAARAYGMSHWTVIRRILLPSALRRALPALSNEVIILLHCTSLAFTATVPDILKVARDVNSATYDTFTAFGLAAVLYASLAFCLVALFRHLEIRYLGYLQRGPAAQARIRQGRWLSRQMPSA